MHTIRDIARLATMLTGLIAPRIRLGFTSATSWLRLDYALASISCEHCRSSRNNPHCVPRHIIYYLLPLRQSLPAPSLRFPQLSLKISGVVDDSFMCRGVYPDMFLLFYTQLHFMF